MLNRPTSPWSDDFVNGQTPWNVDRDPQFRLVILWLAMILPVLVICGRVAQLQLILQESFARAFAATTETVEEIPVFDGRILASDGTLLADDVQRFDVAVHYPLIQDPPDEDWLASKAKPRLSKADRKNKKKLAEEKQKIRDEIESFWVTMAAITNRPVNEVIETRRKEQARIERIKNSVDQRQRDQLLTSFNVAADELAMTRSNWSSAWQRLRQSPDISSLSEVANSGPAVLSAWIRFRRAMEDSPEKSRGHQQIKEELEYQTVVTDVSDDIKREIESHPERYPYTRVLIQSRRTYPQGELASHLIGVRKPLTAEDLQERQKSFPNGDPQDYRIGDLCGQSGLERTYDMHLKGIRGQRVIVKNRRGEVIETRLTREPRRGHDLYLTLDIEVQRRSEKILDKAMTKNPLAGPLDPELNHAAESEQASPQGGCIVAIDVHTGAIIAAASWPRFDLNLLVNPDAILWNDLVSDPRSPFLSRATQMALPPGSVFKVISAVASLESGKMPAHEVFHCRGYLDSPNQPHRDLIFRHFHVGHNEVTLTDALCRSCNVYFYTAARRMGPQNLVDWARQFGIGQRTGIDLPSESAGNLPSPDAWPAAGKKKKHWKPNDTLGMVIGQGELTVTPLQMARVMAAIANDGHLVTPRLAGNSGPTSMSEGDSIRNALTQAESRKIPGLHRDTLDHVREGMEMVVNHPNGTAHKTVQMKEVSIAGKTGTAETKGKVDHAWFAGYVPADQPRIAFCVVLENGGSGGKMAGPVAKEFVKTLLETKHILPTQPIHAKR